MTLENIALIGRGVLKIGEILSKYGPSVAKSVYELRYGRPKTKEEETNVSRVLLGEIPEPPKRLKGTPDEERFKKESLDRALRLQNQYEQGLGDKSLIEETLMPLLIGQALPQLMQSLQGSSSTDGYNPFGLGNTQQASFGGGISQLLGGLAPLLLSLQRSSSEEESPDQAINIQQGAEQTTAPLTAWQRLIQKRQSKDGPIKRENPWAKYQNIQPVIGKSLNAQPGAEQSNTPLNAWQMLVQNGLGKVRARKREEAWAHFQDAQQGMEQ